MINGFDSFPMDQLINNHSLGKSECLLIFINGTKKTKIDAAVVSLFMLWFLVVFVNLYIDLYEAVAKGCKLVQQAKMFIKTMALHVTDNIWLIHTVIFPLVALGDAMLSFIV